MMRARRIIATGVGVGLVACCVFVAFLSFVNRDSPFNASIGDTNTIEAAELPGDIQSEQDATRLKPFGMARIEPFPGAAVASFEILKIWFPIPVVGVDRMKIEANGISPVSIQGQGGGPYELRFDLIESSMVGLSIDDADQLRDLTGQPLELERKWSYQVGAGVEKGTVKFGDIRLRVLDSYPANAELPGSWFSLLNSGNKPVDTNGWRVAFEGLGLPYLVLPSRLISPSQKILVDVNELLSPFGESLRFDPTSRGRMVLFDSSLPPRKIDSVDYELTAADIGLSQTRVGDRWVYSNESVSAQEGGTDEEEQLPEAPVPDFPPGFYNNSLSVVLSSLDSRDEIWYTLDGSSPWQGNSKEYTQAIEIDRGAIIKACTRRGHVTSPVASYTYVIGQSKLARMLPTIGLSNAAFDDRSSPGTISFSADEGGMGSSMEVMDPDGGVVAIGSAFLKGIDESEARSWQAGRAFRLNLAGQRQELVSAFRGLRLGSVSHNEGLLFLPTSSPGKGELIDWLVDKIGLDRVSDPTTDEFAHVAVNGRSLGGYRIVCESRGKGRSVSVRGSLVTTFGDAIGWRQLFIQTLDSDLAKVEELRRLEEHLDLEWFSDYYLMGLFWGDSNWPHRGEVVIQDLGTGKWGFVPNELRDAGSFWPDGRFGLATTKLSASGAIFDALLRSAHFRGVFADRFRTLLELNSNVLQRQVRESLRQLNGVFGSSVKVMNQRFGGDRVSERVTQLKHFLMQQGLISTVTAPELIISDTNSGRSLGITEKSGRVFYSRKADDPILIENDLWLLKSGNEKKVLIPTSDRDFDAWRASNFVDDNWITTNGLVGFDTRGMSGQEIRSQFYELVYNRSSGAFLRSSFDVDINQLNTVDLLVLRCRINDGFVAYLNGEEVVRFNVPEKMQWNSLSTIDIRGTAWRFREFDLTEVMPKLKSGSNVLAIHAVNSMLNGPSFLVDYELVGRREFRGQPVAEAVEYSALLDAASVPSSVHFRREDESHWSGKTSYNVRSEIAPGDLRITHVHFPSLEAPNLEFIEIQNDSDHGISLDAIRLEPLDSRSILRETISPGEVFCFVNKTGIEPFRLQWPQKKVAAIFSGTLSTIPSLSLWGNSRLVDQIDLKWIASTFSENEILEGPFSRAINQFESDIWSRRESFSKARESESSENHLMTLDRVSWSLSTRSGTAAIEIKIGLKPSIMRAEGGDSDASLVVRIGDRSRRVSVEEVLSKIEGDLIDLDPIVLSGVIDGPFGVCLQAANGDWLDSVVIGSITRGSSVFRNKNSNQWQINNASESGIHYSKSEDLARNLTVNEVFLSRRRDELDWAELYNADQTQTIILDGLDVSFNDQTWRLPLNSVIDPRGFLVVPFPNLFVNQEVGADSTFTLGFEERPIDTLTLRTDQGTLGSVGRWPDGGSNLIELSDPTPGAANFISLQGAAGSGIRISEVVANGRQSYREGGDWIEIHNSTNALVDLSGMSVSVGSPDPTGWPFPKGSRILPGGFLFLRCIESNPSSVEFDSRMNMGDSLDEGGDEIYLFDQHKRLLDSVVFGPQLVDRSIASATKGKWAMSKRPTVGARNATSLSLSRSPILVLNSSDILPTAIEMTLINRTGEPARIDGWKLAVIADSHLLTSYTFPPLSFVDDQKKLALPTVAGKPESNERKEVRLMSPDGRIVTRRIVGSEL